MEGTMSVDSQLGKTSPQPEPETSPRRTGIPWVRIAAIGLAILITVAIVALSDKIAELAALGYLGAFLIMLVSNATVIMPAPGLVFVFAMGSTLNPWLLGLAAGTGAALGELTGYMAGYGGATPLENTALYNRFDRWMDRFGPLMILVLSIIPNPLFDMAGLLAGASHMPLWQFLSAAWIGKVVQSTILAWGAALSIGWIEQLLM